MEWGSSREGAILADLDLTLGFIYVTPSPLVMRDSTLSRQPNSSHHQNKQTTLVNSKPLCLVMIPGRGWHIWATEEICLREPL